MVHLPAHSWVWWLSGPPDAWEGNVQLCSVHRTAWREKAKPLSAGEQQMCALEPLDAYLEPERDTKDLNNFAGYVSAVCANCLLSKLPLLWEFFLFIHFFKSLPVHDAQCCLCSSVPPKRCSGHSAAIDILYHQTRLWPTTWNPRCSQAPMAKPTKLPQSGLFSPYWHNTEPQIKYLEKTIKFKMWLLNIG